MPRLYRRIMLIVVLLFGIAAGAMVAFDDRLAGTIARRSLAQTTKIAATRGLDLRDVRFERASFAGFGAVRCDQLTGTVGITRIGAPPSPRVNVAFAADTVVFDAGWPWNDAATLAMINGWVQVLDQGGTPTGEQLSRIGLQAGFPFSWWHPGEATVVIEDEARRMVREGWTRLTVEFSAVARFRVAHRLDELAVRTEQNAGGGSRLALDREDIERVSREYTNPLTQTEIDLVARYPHRAPALLRACEQAARAAREQRHRDRTFPFDAYRHVYWSWLLTKQFGPEFSEEVTDAHEIGATYEVGPAARRMDLQNNAVGRAYALAGVEESELVDRVLTDPNVMRKAVAAAPATR